jgi:hypothetical protein
MQIGSLIARIVFFLSFYLHYFIALATTVTDPLTLTNGFLLPQ